VVLRNRYLVPRSVNVLVSGIGVYGDSRRILAVRVPSVDQILKSFKVRKAGCLRKGIIIYI
jgi:hypothetical protein